MKKIGITGGIGSGKSLVCSILAKLGYPIYHADERARWLTENDPQIRKAVIQLLGSEAYTPAGYNRQFVGNKVFQDARLLEALNAIIHPVVLQDFEAWCDAQTHKGYNLVFKEAAILFEAGTTSGLDAVVLVTAPKSIRIKRIRARDPHLTQADIEARIAKQWTDEQKTPLADFVINNDGETLLTLQIHHLLTQLQAL